MESFSKQSFFHVKIEAVSMKNQIFPSKNRFWAHRDCRADWVLALHVTQLACV